MTSGYPPNSVSIQIVVINSSIGSEVWPVTHVRTYYLLQFIFTPNDNLCKTIQLLRQNYDRKLHYYAYCITGAASRQG